MPGRYGRSVMIGLAALLLGAGTLEAQASVYGIRGLGFPGRAANARERALGSAFLALDPGSPVNPAGAAGFGTITVSVMGETDFRSYTIDTVDVSGLTSTRFPMAQLGGRFGASRLSFAIGFAQYTDRSYELTFSDTMMLRGAPVAYEERTSSRGGMTDLRGALGYRVSDRLWLGGGVHILTGSARLTFVRSFADSAFRPFRIETDESVSGMGYSVGAIYQAGQRVAFGLSLRSDTRATVEVDSVTAADVDLPVTVTGGLRVSLTRSLRMGGTAVWRSWGSADADLAGRAFDTWEVGGGLEFGGPETGTSRFPMRIGARYATLPFAPTDEQPTEIGLGIGTGLVFAGGRGLIDVALERAMRNGPGSDETAWQLSWSVTVRP